MKKILLFTVAIAALSLLASCSKNEDLSKAKVNVNMAVSELGTGTKAIKSGWEVGDKIYVYLDKNETITPDFTLTFNGTRWVASEITTSFEAYLSEHASGYLRGFWEQSGVCMGSPWSQGSWFIQFPSYSNYSTTGIMDYLVADFSGVTYHYDGNTLSAAVTTWRFRSNVPIVVTGITHSPGQYTLYSDQIDNFGLIDIHSGLGAPYEINVSYHSTGSGEGRIAGIKNDDGVAFVGGLSYNLSEGQKMTLYLIDNFATPSAKTYKYEKTMGPSGFYDDEFHAVKIPFSSFTLVP